VAFFFNNRAGGGAMSAELKQIAATGAPASGWKPYPAYKDSGVEWIGKVPEHWEMKKIKWIFKVINGSTPKTGNPEYWDGDVPWITPDDLGHLHSDTIYEPARKITESGYKNCGTTLVPVGSLVLSTRAPIGVMGTRFHISGIE
jgi:type I restriction enzyme S subunit